jgi:hypothetical protein
LGYGQLKSGHLVVFTPDAPNDAIEPPSGADIVNAPFRCRRRSPEAMSDRLLVR